MTSSGTTSFAPSIGELLLYSFGLIGLRRAEITQQHFTDAHMAVNLMLADWNNSTPNLWKVSLVTQDLIAGVASYNVDPSCIVMLDAYIHLVDDTAADRIIWPISRTEYASLPNKDQIGYPTVFWMDRLLSPTVTLWMVPPATGVVQLKYYQVTQVFDANLPNGETPDIPIWWLRAFAYGLADQLCDSYPPEDPTRVQRIAAKAAKYLEDAQTQGVEVGNTLYIGPNLGGYFSR